jgi:hypothetical protein
MDELITLYLEEDTITLPIPVLKNKKKKVFPKTQSHSGAKTYTKKCEACTLLNIFPNTHIVNSRNFRTCLNEIKINDNIFKFCGACKKFGNLLQPCNCYFKNKKRRLNENNKDNDETKNENVKEYCIEIHSIPLRSVCNRIISDKYIPLCENSEIKIFNDNIYLSNETTLCIDAKKCREVYVVGPCIIKLFGIELYIIKDDNKNIIIKNELNEKLKIKNSTLSFRKKFISRTKYIYNNKCYMS